MKKILSSLLFASNAYAQCPPPMEPMSSTVRLPDPRGLVLTVGEYDGPTRNVVSSYEYTEWTAGQVGTMSADGNITFTNKTADNRRMTYRMSILLPDGSEPSIPDVSILCWEPNTNRIIVVYDAVVGPNAEVVVPIAWDVVVRNSGMLADLNGDGRVDAADQGILFSAWGTSDRLSDLNTDGVVNAEDLGILLSNWSEYSEDVVEN